MLKTAVLAGLVLLDDIKPRPKVEVSRAETYISAPVPSLRLAVAPIKSKRTTKPRKKHVCGWSDEVVWAVFWLGLILGGFVVHCFF